MPILRPERITVYRLELPLIEPFTTSFGTASVRSIALVSLEQDGITAWGECVSDALPLYSPEYTKEAVLTWEQALFPLLTSHPLSHPAEWVRRSKTIKGHPMAKAAIEMALWDLWGQFHGQSLADLWQGRRTHVPVGVSIGLQETDERLIDRIQAYMDEGYKRIKLKIRPGRDITMLEKVRTTFPNIPLTVDANAAYRWPQDFEQLKNLDTFRLEMIEQPFPPDEWLGHRSLQKHIQTPLCLDESITSLATLKLALRLRAARIINIKPGRLGGYTIARKIHNVCYRRNIPVWCGGMLETGIGRAANVALASLPGFTLPNDLSASRRYWHEDIVEPEFILGPNSTLEVPKGPGLGVKILRERLNRYLVHQWSIQAV